MNGGAVERMLAVVDAEKSSCLLEGLGPETTHVQELLAGLEHADVATVVDDVLRQTLRQTGDPTQK